MPQQLLQRSNVLAKINCHGTRVSPVKRCVKKSGLRRQQWNCCCVMAERSFMSPSKFCMSRCSLSVDLDEVNPSNSGPKVLTPPPPGPSCNLLGRCPGDELALFLYGDVSLTLPAKKQRVSDDIKFSLLLESLMQNKTH